MSRLALLGVVACVTGPGVADPEAALDWDQFVDEVQPVLETCANPACHGRADRALEVYAPGLHRADPSDLWLEEPLTEAELIANYTRALGFAIGEEPLACDLVCKPLAVHAGGCTHRGGVLHGDETNPDHQALVDWLAAVEEVVR